MTLDELVALAPTAVEEMTREFVHKAIECIKANPESQLTACFLLALRASSLLCGMALLLRPNTRDSWDVLARAFMETRDLLLDFRSDDEETRQKIKRWFRGNVWKVEYKRVEAFLNQLSGGELELAKRWGMFSGFSHPTVTAARRSAALTVSRVTGRQLEENPAAGWEAKVEDYLMSIATLIIATSDLPGWIRLGCDPSRMPNVRPFRDRATAAAVLGVLTN